MKIIGLCVLHYGSDFLGKSIRALEKYVDEYHIIYSKKPSFSFETGLKCPDTEKELREIAEDSSNKIVWHSYESFKHEGHHRNEIKRFTDIKDLIIVSDADEVWEDPEPAINQALNTRARNFNINGFVNFWKSEKYVVIDWFQPTRMYRYDQPEKTQIIDATIYHYGYMISPEAMRYKLSIHGHKNDIMRVHGSTDNYFKKWQTWTHPGCGVYNLHPASETIWHDAKEYNK